MQREPMPLEGGAQSGRSGLDAPRPFALHCDVPSQPGDFLATSRLEFARRAEARAATVRAHLRHLDRDPDPARRVRDRQRIAAACLRAGQLALAAEALEPLLDPKLRHAAAAELMGDVQLAAGNTAKAEAALLLCLQADLRQPRALGKLAALFAQSGRFEQARALLHESIAQQDNADAYFTLGQLHASRGEHDQALTALEIAMQLAPRHALIGSAWVLRHAYLENSDDAALLAAGREWQRRYAGDIAPLPPAPSQPFAGRRLRVAYLSPDFRRHSTAYFFRPLLRHHDRGTFEIFCYHDSAACDDLTLAIRSLAEHWRPIHGRTDRAVAEQMRRDRIDLVVDLAGHFVNPHLTLHALRPAPVHVHHVGFCGTTGLSSFDARLTDEIIEPPGAEIDALSAEPLVRVPGGLHCFNPFDTLPSVEPTPALRQGFVTFGSFNAQSKLNPTVLRTWARILQRVPTARLFFKNPELADFGLREQLRNIFAAQGVGPDRLVFAGPSPRRADQLAAYHGIDIHLDSFPYNGVTTTCEALWMGVPVLTVRGNCHRGRIGESLLRRAGEADAVARDLDDYVERAVVWAGDIAGLAAQRLARRARILSSALADGAAHARSIEHVWCALTRQA